jgi:hypothetical protein
MEIGVFEITSRPGITLSETWHIRIFYDIINFCILIFAAYWAILTTNWLYILKLAGIVYYNILMISKPSGDAGYPVYP